MHLSTRTAPASHSAVALEQLSTWTLLLEQPTLPHEQTPPGAAQQMAPVHGSVLPPTPTEVHEHESDEMLHSHSPQVQLSLPLQQTTGPPMVASLHSLTGSTALRPSHTQKPRLPGLEHAPLPSLLDEHAGTSIAQPTISDIHGA